ncbi:hypothetical protein AYY19_01070 [Photobacterium aquimaris]|uniref:hypothetical protein n=1 Tax=Photobacterium aquimaris TaxID=512643 RepID=UPI0007F03F58|nr:hypothetical protein [Photobacterium aquimaris]OBU18494.1 hypothetical protein AYY19_01070 [Photobacterium aquimaris]PSW03169.1 hypothetical protein CTM91_02565 [Photobacterium aquimaris]
MGYLTLFSLPLSVLLINATSITTPATSFQYALHSMSAFSVTSNEENWNDNVIILSNNTHKTRQLSKTEKKNFVPALNCDNNATQRLHPIISHYSKHQRYPLLELANFQYRFTHSRRQLRLLNYRDIYFNYDSDYKDYIDA